MSDAVWQGIQPDDEDLDEAGNQELRGRNSHVFLIDCTKEMFQDINDGDDGDEKSNTLFDMAIQCAATMTKNKIISSETDLISVIFYGTEKFDVNTKNTYVFQELEEPGAEIVLRLNKLLADGREKFATIYGHSNKYSLSDALWSCMSVFSKCKLTLGTRRIILFTCEDDPHSGDEHLRRQVRQKAQDIHENGIEFELIDLKPFGRTFDVNKFYKDILLTEDLERRPNSTNKIDELLMRVRRKDSKKRSLGSLIFTIPGGVHFAIKLFHLVQELKKPSSVRLEKSTNEVVQKMNKTYLADTGEVLLPSDINFYKEYAGKQISFEASETREIKHLFEPGIMLLGFKPSSLVKIHRYSRPAGFLYPDEDNISGSKRIFLALLDRCAERAVSPICRMVARKSATPEIVALFHQREIRDENNVQIAPPGFHAFSMPFADDIRALDIVALMNKGGARNPDENASEVQIEMAKDVVKKLQFNFKSENFENPVLQTHWRNIEALALDLDMPDEVTDYTLPIHDAMQKRAGALIEKFKQSCLSDGDAFLSQPKKRQHGSSGEPHLKKTKVDTSQINFKKKAQSGQLHQLTADILKSFCSTVNIKVAGKKKIDLIDAIEEHFKNV